MKDQTPSSTNALLDSLSQFLTYRISRLHGKLNAQASRMLRETVGLTLIQWRIVAFVGSAGEITASELIGYTDMDKGLVSRNVKRLIAEGVVTSGVDRDDSRVHVLSLTPRGQALFDTALPVMRRRQAHLQNAISEADMATFRRVMAALEEAAQDTIL